MRILAIDTALGQCALALVEDGQARAVRREAMLRGHAEALAPMAEALMREACARFSDLDRIAVTVGPGSFTGLRVGLAFARALGAALQRPVVGVSTLEAMARAASGRVLAIHGALEGAVYAQAFEDAVAVSAPNRLSLDEAAALAGPGAVTLAGTAAQVLSSFLPHATRAPDPLPDPVALARLAADAIPADRPPAPLYLRPPDAKLPGGRTPIGLA
jgi:tRNA threonylcarbamoyladenosine biosynthesis protein TsaB